MNGMREGEPGKRVCDLFCFHFVLGSDCRSVSDEEEEEDVVLHLLFLSACVKSD